MILFPAVDVLDNRAVRLLYGKREDVTVYGTPVDMALKWQDMGAEYLHIVDLNGAFDDSLVNRDTLIDLIKNVSIPVQIGGGIKTFDKIKFYLEEVGASRVIVGTACVTNPNLMDKACLRYRCKRRFSSNQRLGRKEQSDASSSCVGYETARSGYGDLYRYKSRRRAVRSQRGRYAKTIRAKRYEYNCKRRYGNA